LTKNILCGIILKKIDEKERIMKKRNIFITVCVFILMFSGVAYAGNESSAKVYFNGDLLDFGNPLIIDEGCTIVPVRELSEKADFEIEWDSDEKRVDAFSEDINVTLYIDIADVFVEKDGKETRVESIIPPRIINSVTYVPLRTVSEAFGAEVIWDGEKNIIYINMGEEYKNFRGEVTEEEMPGDTEVSGEISSTFYSQYAEEYVENYSDEPYGWTAGRNGYCYVTSYAMLLSDITGERITPIDIADINISAGGSPKVCYHGAIVGKYGKKLVQALDSGSLYFKSYDSGRGLTYIDNSTEENVVAAIKEALDRNPMGIMVRDLSMPHTMVAVRYEGDTIYFNDPALDRGEVTWEETCLKKQPITTLVAIMAIQ